MRRVEPELVRNRKRVWVHRVPQDNRDILLYGVFDPVTEVRDELVKGAIRFGNLCLALPALGVIGRPRCLELLQSQVLYRLILAILFLLARWDAGDIRLPCMDRLVVVSPCLG